VILRYETEVRAGIVTVDQAVEIRHLRVDQEATWRHVGEEVQTRWLAEVGLGDTQSLGATACHVAAELLGEDPDQDPWN